jgi:hypothetical protein
MESGNSDLESRQVQCVETGRKLVFFSNGKKEIDLTEWLQTLINCLESTISSKTFSTLLEK